MLEYQQVEAMHITIDLRHRILYHTFNILIALYSTGLNPWIQLGSQLIYHYKSTMYHL